MNVADITNSDISSLDLYVYGVLGWLEILLYVGLIIYASWDWIQLRKYIQETKVKDSFPGFNKVTVSWGLKIFFVYLFCFWVVMSCHQLYMYSEQFRDVYIYNESPTQQHVSFQSKQVKSDVQPVSNHVASDQLETGVEIYVIEGMLPTESIEMLWLNWSSILINLIALWEWYLFFRLFHAFSRSNFFTFKNTIWLRWLAVLIFLHQSGYHGLYQTISNWYVETNFNFPSSQNEFSITNIDYGILIISLSILILAEIIRAGAVMKEEQELTV